MILLFKVKKKFLKCFYDNGIKKFLYLKGYKELLFQNQRVKSDFFENRQY